MNIFLKEKALSEESACWEFYGDWDIGLRLGDGVVWWADCDVLLPR